MKSQTFLTPTFLLICLYVISPFLALAQNQPPAPSLFQGFEHPPDDSRIMMRWWWFGPSATREEISAELQHMKDAGIGGVELQATYPMALDDPEHGFRNYRFLSPEFLDMVGFASRKAKELGLRMDLTIGSGWPYGGPYIQQKLAARLLRSEARELPPGQTTVSRPAAYDGEHLLAAFIAHGSLGETDARSFQELDLSGQGPIAIPNNQGPRTLLFFFSAPTGQAVKRAAFGAEGYVLDHYNKAAIETHLREAGDKLLGAAAPGTVHSIFCDSLEVYGSNWTEEMFGEFQKRRGYDLKPLLPLLEYDAGERSTTLRRDYGRTLSETFEDNFLVPMREWSRKNHVLFRMQDYGTPPATISSYRYVDLPEGEGFPWRKLTSTRWAASAAHLFGKPVVSSETWTWVHSPAFRATPLDLKAEADLHFLMGINQLVGHGWPYSPPQAGHPGWTFYAAGALNNNNPWWPVMPDLSLYLQRVSYLLRQGEPVTDVALYAPTEDAYVTMKPSLSNHFDLFEQIGEQIGPKIIPDILNAGLNFDLIDDGTLKEAAAQHYKAIILPAATFIPEKTRQWLMDFQHNGGILIAADHRPASEWSNVEIVPEPQLSKRIASAIKPDLELSSDAEDIGHVHRQSPDADIFFLANTANVPRKFRARFRTKYSSAELWNAMTGKREQLTVSNGEIQLNLEPYGSRVIVFQSSTNAPKPASIRTASTKDLSDGWKVNVGSAAIDNVNVPYSWSSNSATQYFSGTTIFTKDLQLSSSEAASSLSLDFGEAMPTQREALANGTLRGYSFAALVAAPIREAATVFVNGKRAGSIWAPPYQIDLTGLLHAGTNTLRVDVYNTAINELAQGGHIPDVTALTNQYGLRFRLQDFDGLKPLPSGILSAVKLVVGQNR